MEDVRVVANSPINSPIAGRNSSDLEYGSSVLIGGTNFGFSEEQILILEECVVEAKERCSGLGTSKYFEDEIESIQRQLDWLKCTVKEQKPHQDKGMFTETCDRDGRASDLSLVGQAMSLKSRVTGLLRELDEMEWEDKSTDARDWDD